MTERLYYKDPELLEFDAVVVETGNCSTGFYVVLDRSTFYPTSGGQSHDTGCLGGVPVEDVVETDDGEVRHLVPTMVGAVGTKVHGSVNKERRLRNRQNHTAQHILSAAFHRLYGFRTMSVHLGEEYGAVELGVDSITEEQLSEAETAANRVIADNVTIEVTMVDSRQAETLPLRKEPQREGELRIVRIGEFDYSACGGTHCLTSGGVGLVKIIGVEKIRGRTLVKYLAGTLAVSDYQVRYRVTESLSRSFTCHPTDLVDKVAKMSGEISSLKRRLVDIHRELLPIKATALARGAVERGRFRVLVDEVDEMEPAMATRLAGLVADSIGGLAVLYVDGRIVLATSQGSGLHAGNLARKLAEHSGLKGGGSERAAQLGGASAQDIDIYRSAVYSALEHE